MDFSRIIVFQRQAKSSSMNWFITVVACQEGIDWIRATLVSLPPHIGKIVFSTNNNNVPGTRQVLLVNEILGLSEVMSCINKGQ